ncbi:hypothetical protein LPTSP4_24820 [Leptospira ryugenii]|uniref:Uncharacterized protein n=1 Tax=Leptospira ryugenii TaxID=1917863 RepID=A0A2P2E239_9LEPT|nr:hypothetical protein [Leptospira ryugenii]GBF50951.1 hypothetical protein LPTSP4_24820 [Leptospira ryugenii]
MDVRINRLLNSAERFVQDKKESKETDKANPNLASSVKTELNAAGQSDFAVSLPIQYHNIQTRLTELQRQLSREQARAGILEDQGTAKEDLIKILFENEPLFPELLGDSTSLDRQSALSTSKGEIQNLTQELRKKEVEGENIFSLGMILSPEEFKGKIEGLSSNFQKPLSENVVKRLLGG